jgi:adenosylcobyric acid synthase
LAGYEIHLGATSGPDCDRPFVEIAGRPDGATSADGRVSGTYVHGVFGSDRFRHAFLAGLGATPGPLDYAGAIDGTLDSLAAYLEAHLDIDQILNIAGWKSQITSAASATMAKKSALAPT